MISSLCWIKRGIAHEDPLVLKLGPDDIADLIANTQKNLEISESPQSDNEDQDEAPPTDNLERDDTDDIKEFNMDDYDNEDNDAVQRTILGAGLSGVAYYADPNEDPFITLPEIARGNDGEDEYKVRPSDSMICCPKMEEDMSTLEIHIWNQDEEDFYVHHDLVLDSLPLCLAWLNFDVGYNPEDGIEREKGNYLAIGSMTPQIEIWDLDIVNSSEPVGFLGERRKASKKKPKVGKKGHSDSVMSLSWNQHTENILASGSADKHIMLWDLETSSAKDCLSLHQDKVSTVAWHLAEPTTLLSGGYDSTCFVTDCRTKNNRKWELDSQIEQAIWDINSPYSFLVGTSSGSIFCIDIRQNSPLYTISAHDDEVAGIAVTRHVPGLLASCGADEIVKIWDVSTNKPSFVISRKFPDSGALNCLGFCPDYPTMLAIGGIKGGLVLWDPATNKNFRTHFNIPDE